jgi:hypothetical protein
VTLVDTAGGAWETARMKRFALLVSIVVAAAACGGSEKPSNTVVTAPEPDQDKGMEHGKLTPELDAFHETLAPRWHADKGEARMKDTCGALADFQAKSAAIKAAPASMGADPAAWTDAGAQLEVSVTGLASACGGTDLAAFETAFEAVHNSFHHAMELVVGKHDMEGSEHGMEGGEHHEGEHHEGTEHH